MYLINGGFSSMDVTQALKLFYFTMVTQRLLYHWYMLFDMKESYFRAIEFWFYVNSII